MVADRDDNFSKKAQIEMRKRHRAEVAGDQGLEGTGSVDAFLGTYTSEDNASFVQLQEEEMIQRKEDDVWGQKREMLLQREREKKMLLLENGSHQPTLAIKGSKPLLAIEGSGKEVEVYREQLLQAALSSQEKVIDKNNTRISADVIKRLNAKPQVVDATGKRKKLSLLVQKNRLLGDTRGRGVDLDDFFDAPKDEAAAESEPTVGGFKFITTPQIVPGGGGAVEESPLVSWGTVQGTPVILERGKQFTMPDVPERDKVAQKLADSKSKKLNTPVVRSGKSSTRGKTPLASPVFSPAGQKLLEARLKQQQQNPMRFKSPSITPGREKKTSLSRSSVPFQSPARRK
jgi:hypothetical protein